MILIYDYGVGNVRSLQRAWQRLGCDVVIDGGEPAIMAADGIVFPGVGSFGQAVATLAGQDVMPLLTKRVRDGLPVMGICLGMQIMFTSSDESVADEGLGWFEGKISRLNVQRIPHMGWSKIEPHNINCPSDYLYFAHSYHACNVDDSIVAAVCRLEPDVEIVAAIKHKNVLGLQFHPEKSQSSGSWWLKLFADMCGEGDDHAS